jgi:hypothetical protein
MATLADITSAIDRLLTLNVTRQTLHLNSARKEKAFEAYALALLATAVSRAGGTYQTVGIISGNNPSTIVFRSAPGSIFSRSQDFSFLDCSLNTKRFEIHIDVEYEGNTRATHEMDVSLVEHEHADQCRRGNRNPRKALFTAECKFFSSSIPSIGLARGLVGLVSDFNLKIGSAFISNGATDNLKNYLAKKSRPDRFTELSPLNPGSEEDVISVIANKLRKWASV